jgi:parallel beta-helix repeat protein
MAMTVFRYVVALALALLVVPATALAGGGAATCGATITSSTKLRADLTNCPGDGLVVGADNITLDLGRRTIDGSGAAGSQGIRLAGRRGVKITGGTVQEFATGIGFDASDGNRVSGVSVRGSAGRGIDVLNGSDGNRFERVTATGNRTGLAATASERNSVSRSTFVDNAITGVLLFGASRNVIAGNRISGSAGNGIAAVEASNDNRVLANATQGAETGLIVDTSDRNLLALNRVTGGGDGVLVAGSGNTVAQNIVDRSVGGCETCSGWGIGITTGEGNVVKANGVTRSAADGINVAAVGTWVGLNVALKNGGLGISAVPGVVDGGRNVASGNGNAAQCVGVACKSPRSDRRVDPRRHGGRHG